VVYLNLVVDEPWTEPGPDIGAVVPDARGKHPSSTATASWGIAIGFVSTSENWVPSAETLVAPAAALDVKK